MSHQFCSRLAQHVHGVFAGTGVKGRGYVFLPVNKQLWGHAEINPRWAEPQDVAAIKAARRSGIVVRLYDPADASSPVLVHRAPDAGPTDEEAIQRLLGALAAKGWPIQSEPLPILALCTQGTRDRCCAKWGFQVYRRARQLHEAGRLPFRPIECSHLGGDRFAATGIVFPSGSMYGHLDQVDLEALGAIEAADRFLVDHYRGRVFESPVVQVVRAGLSREGIEIGATSPIVLIRHDQEAGTAEVQIGPRHLAVELGSEELRFFGDCEAVEEEKRSRATRIVYRGHRLMANLGDQA